MKVPQGQAPNNQPSSSRQQASTAAADGSPKERIFLSKEAIAKVKKAVALGRLLPSNASRDELMAYNKLASERTQQMRRWRLAMEKQEEADRERRNSRKPPPRSDSSDHDSPVRNKSKLSKLRRTNKARVVQKLEDDFQLEKTTTKKNPLRQQKPS